MEKYITLSSFAYERSVQRTTIWTYIKRLDEKITSAGSFKDGRDTMIDTESELYSILDKKYPIKTELQNIEQLKDALLELRELNSQNLIELNHLQNRIIEKDAQITQLTIEKQKYIDSQQEIDDKKTIINLLEAQNNEKKAQLDLCSFKDAASQKQIETLQDENKALQEKLQELQNQLDQEKNKSFIKRLFTK